MNLEFYFFSCICALCDLCTEHIFYCNYTENHVDDGTSRNIYVFLLSYGSPSLCEYYVNGSI
jgi:hypothetical protein